MKNEIQNIINQWIKSPFDNETIEEIKKIISDKDEKELIDRFYKNLSFGTGGLRGVIGAGINRMNIYTVGFATQGLANYIIKNKGADKGVVIGYDPRYKSDVFAKETAAILIGNGIKVFLFDDIMPTPLVSFALKELNAKAGIVITASHNPKEYNGYKVYWEDGGQIIPPHDKNIIDEVNNIRSIEQINKIDYNEGVSNNKIQIIGNKIIQSYIKNLEKFVLHKVNDSNIKIVYTPIHGTGYKIIPEVLNHFGFTNVFLEKEQSIPDWRFPTVKSPNPEEKEALTYALNLAEQKNADIVIATDPDADRMGIAFKNNNNEFSLINGNQIGAMLEYYILLRMQEKNMIPENGCIIKTIVTSEIQSVIAKDFNCEIIDVLTGFKWIASEMEKFENSKEYKFIFGGEESYGYLPVNFVRDKDAVSSAYFFTEMADWLNKKGRSLNDFLDSIYIKYGLYLESLHSILLKGKEGSEKIIDIMSNFRKNPPAKILDLNVIQLIDYDDQVIRFLEEKRNIKINNLPKANVLQLILEDNSKITLRPSGTEPKIKFYFSVNKKTDKNNLSEDKIYLDKKLTVLYNELLKIIGQ